MSTNQNPNVKIIAIVGIVLVIIIGIGIFAFAGSDDSKEPKDGDSSSSSSMVSDDSSTSKSNSKDDDHEGDDDHDDDKNSKSPKESNSNDTSKENSDRSIDRSVSSSSQSESNSVSEVSRTTTQNPTLVTDEVSSNTLGGEYLDYSEETVEKLDDQKKVLFFKASWCPSCTLLDKNINQELEGIPDDVTILKVDYDEETDLKQKYNIVSQHTLVQIDEQGNELKKWSGSRDLDSILEEVI